MNSTRRRCLLLTAGGFGYSLLMLLAASTVSRYWDPVSWRWWPLPYGEEAFLVTVCTSPLSLLCLLSTTFAPGTVVLGVPFIWALVGLLAALSQIRIVWHVLDITLAAHYVWIAAILFILWLGLNELFRGNEPIPWTYDAPVVVGVVGIYLAGQIALWRVLARIRRDSRHGVPADAVVEPPTVLGRVLPWMGAGFGCGLVLLLLSAAVLKAGSNFHTRYIPQLILVTLYASPVSLLPTRFVFVATPLWWAFIGLLLAMVDRPRARRGLWLALLAHYAGALFLLPNLGFGDWRHFEKDWAMCLSVCSDKPGAVFAGLFTYILMQCALWVTVDWRIQETSQTGDRWQYSLRTLLFAVLVVAVGLTWARAEFARARRGMDADKIRALGGNVSRVSDGDFSGDRAIRPNAVLSMVNLSGTAAADRHLTHLKGIPNIYALNLRRTQVTDSGLLEIESLQTLRYLTVADSLVTNAGIERLRRVRPDINLEREDPTWGYW